MALTHDNTPRRVRLKVVTWPEPAKDVAELIQHHGPEAFQSAIDNARPIHEWAIDHVDEWFDTTTSEGKDEAVEDLVETLITLPPIERMERVRQLAEKLGIPVEEVRAALNETYLARHGHMPDRPKVVAPPIWERDDS